MGDGSVRWLAETIGPREMVALLTRAGGEVGVGNRELRIEKGVVESAEARIGFV
jgi:hypothetical protein